MTTQLTLTVFDRDFLRSSIVHEFHRCKEWEMEKMVQLIDLAVRLGFTATAKELQDDLKTEIFNSNEI